MESNFHSPFSNSHSAIRNLHQEAVLMSEPKRIAETALAYGAATADLQAPVILAHEGRPVAVLLPFAEYERLRLLEREAQQRRQKAWLDLEAMMVAAHNRPTDMTPEQIEAEIGEARAEVQVAMSIF